MTEPYPFPTSADEFADKRVLVTGGTRGIGAAVVRRFQLAGARVVATARSAPAHAVDGVLFIPADIGTAAGVETRCQSAGSRLGRARHPGQQRRRRGNQTRRVRIPVRRRLAGDH